MPTNDPGETSPAHSGAGPGPAHLLQAPSPSALRAELEEAVLNDLLGPAGGPAEEVPEARVRDRYLVGMLAPRRQRLSPEEFDELALGGDGFTEDGTPDPSAPPAETLFPSSFGMSFCVTGEATALQVTARWGRYQRIGSETLVTAKTGSPRQIWKRTPIEAVSAPIPLAEGPVRHWVVSNQQPEVIVQWRVRRSGDGWIVTLFLVNGQGEPKQLRDHAWIFQPELVVEAVDGSAVFCRQPRHRRPDRVDPAAYAEEQALAMLYRCHLEFAVGHGVGVHAEAAPDNPERAVRLSTAVAPAYEVPKQTPPTPEDSPALAGLVLDMKELAETDRAGFAAKLGPLPNAYAAWIADQRRKIGDPAEQLDDAVEAANAALANGDQALARIREGIALLAADEQAAEAFRFASRAMWLQRTRSLYAEAVRRGRSPEMAAIDVPRNRTWYPFQLAFILLNLPSLTDLHHPARSHASDAVADLLWFPTGGGKTEAYLGLAAYTMALRRLQGTVAGRSGEHGVAVLMRYTLRLLTLQQFQRASALMCACEAIRREAEKTGDSRWGREAFRIGLWVGQRATPNWTDQSAEAIKQDHGHYQRGSAIAGSGSPAQLTNCPWCGAAIDRGKNIKVKSYARGQGRTITYCGDPLGRCLFSERQSPREGIPVIVVDEEIYRRLSRGVKLGHRGRRQVRSVARHGRRRPPNPRGQSAAAGGCMSALALRRSRRNPAVGSSELAAAWTTSTLRRVSPPPRYEPFFSQVVLVERLREVRSLLGFTRIESAGDFADVSEIPEDRRAPLSRLPPRWLPASEVRGEGIFLQFNEEAVARWCQGARVARRQREFWEDHRQWRRVRRIEPADAGFPFNPLRAAPFVRPRSDAAVRPECGYTEASIRERIYSREPEADNGRAPAGGGWAAVLLYTAAPDSEGTLGGLVSLGGPEALARHLDQALEQMRLCASDPLCADYQAHREGITLHGAACHACLFAPETSCERGNRYLDRTLLVHTFGPDSGAFFEPQDGQP